MFHQESVKSTETHRNLLRSHQENVKSTKTHKNPFKVYPLKLGSDENFDF